MEIKLRQRLIGAVVLAAIIIIVVPSLFKSPHSNQKSITLTSTIPPEPAKPTIQTVNQISPDENAAPAQASTIALGNNPLSNSAQNSSSTNAANVQASSQQQVQSLPLPPTPAQAKAQQGGVGLNDAINNGQQAELGQTQPIPVTSPTQHKIAASKSQSKVAHAKSAPNTDNVSNSQFVANQIADSMQTQATATTSAAMPSANAWVIQLGAFSNIDNAKDLEKTLRSNGFTAFTRNIKTSKGNLMRVMIGPETQRDQAEKVLTKLTNELKLNGVIVPFDSLQAK